MQGFTADTWELLSAHQLAMNAARQLSQGAQNFALGLCWRRPSDGVMGQYQNAVFEAFLKSPL